VAQVLKMLLNEATGLGIEHKIVHREPGVENGTLVSATIMWNGEKVEPFLNNWLGTVQWIGQSKFRKHHKRKNWFVGMNKLDLGESFAKVHDRDIRYEFTRSGGPGGQHVNKVSTAVRAIHVPTGETVFASQERSQLQNKNEARRKLLKRLEERQFQETKERIKEEWENHNQLERGNPVRVFTGSDFKPNHQKKKYKSGRKGMKQEIARHLDD